MREKSYTCECHTISYSLSWFCMHVHRVPVTSSFLHGKQPSKNAGEKRSQRDDREK